MVFTNALLVVENKLTDESKIPCLRYFLDESHFIALRKNNLARHG
jgi:hypothetical protein